MINNSKENKYKVLENIYSVFSQDLLPIAHVEFLELLKSDFNNDFKVIYDIGSCVMHWQRWAKKIWKNADIYCFDAFTPLVELYKKENVNFDNVLLYSDDNCKIKFYQNDLFYGGNSIYKENTSYFPNNNYIIKETITLDTLVEQKKYPYPNLIKIDCQSGELDILRGAKKCLEHATHLIIELPKENIEYNIGAPKQHEVIDYLKNIGYLCLVPAFSGNPADDDYCFVNYQKLKLNV